MIPNRQGITRIEFERQIQAYCPLGKDFYNVTLSVDMEPDEYFMDYIETDYFIKSLSGSANIIEDLVEKLFNHVKKYKPKCLSVTAYAESNTHFPVTVTKEEIL